MKLLQIPTFPRGSPRLGRRRHIGTFGYGAGSDRSCKEQISENCLGGHNHHQTEPTKSRYLNINENCLGGHNHHQTDPMKSRYLNIKRGCMWKLSWGDTTITSTVSKIAGQQPMILIISSLLVQTIPDDNKLDHNHESSKSHNKRPQ